MIIYINEVSVYCFCQRFRGYIMIPYTSDHPIKLVTLSLLICVCLFPVINDEIHEVHEKTDHEYVDYDPYDQNRYLIKLIDQSNRSVVDYN